VSLRWAVSLCWAVSLRLTVSLCSFRVRVRARIKYCVRCSVLGVNYIRLLSSTLKFPA
jgi:hypothetical protein